MYAKPRARGVVPAERPDEAVIPAATAKGEDTGPASNLDVEDETRVVRESSGDAEVDYERCVIPQVGGQPFGELGKLVESRRCNAYRTGPLQGIGRLSLYSGDLARHAQGFLQPVGAVRGPHLAQQASDDLVGRAPSHRAGRRARHHTVDELPRGIRAEGDEDAGYVGVEPVPHEPKAASLGAKARRVAAACLQVIDPADYEELGRLGQLEGVKQVVDDSQVAYPQSVRLDSHRREPVGGEAHDFEVGAHAGRAYELRPRLGELAKGAVVPEYGGRDTAT